MYVYVCCFLINKKNTKSLRTKSRERTNCMNLNRILTENDYFIQYVLMGITFEKN